MDVTLYVLPYATYENYSSTVCNYARVILQYYATQSHSCVSLRH